MGCITSSDSGQVIRSTIVSIDHQFNQFSNDQNNYEHVKVQSAFGWEEEKQNYNSNNNQQQQFRNQNNQNEVVQINGDSNQRVETRLTNNENSQHQLQNVEIQQSSHPKQQDKDIAKGLPSQQPYQQQIVSQNNVVPSQMKNMMSTIQNQIVKQYEVFNKEQTSEMMKNIQNTLRIISTSKEQNKPIDNPTKEIKQSFQKRLQHYMQNERQADKSLNKILCTRNHPMQKLTFTIDNFEEQCTKCAVPVAGEQKAPFFYSCVYVGCPSTFCVKCFRKAQKDWKLVDTRWKLSFQINEQIDCFEFTNIEIGVCTWGHELTHCKGYIYNEDGWDHLICDFCRKDVYFESMEPYWTCRNKSMCSMYMLCDECYVLHYTKEIAERQKSKKSLVTKQDDELSLRKSFFPIIVAVTNQVMCHQNHNVILLQGNLYGLYDEPGAFCDICRKEVTNAKQFWACVSCHYDVCCECFSSFIAQDTEEQQKKQGTLKIQMDLKIKKKLQGKCNSGHPLLSMMGNLYEVISGDQDVQHNCDICEAVEINKQATFWNCIKCKYDCCNACFIERYGANCMKEQSEVAQLHMMNDMKFIPPFRQDPKCQKDHTLVCLSGKIYPKGLEHNCHECGDSNLVQQKNFWNCFVCEYDICQKCLVDNQGPYVIVPKIEQTCIVSKIQGKEWLTCFLRHILKQTVGKVYVKYDFVSCNTCGKQYMEDEKYFWNCSICDFDNCKSCGRKALRSKTQQEAKEILKRQKKETYRNMWHERGFQYLRDHGEEEYKQLMQCFTDNYLRKRKAIKIAQKDWTAALIQQIRYEIVEVLKDKNAYKSGKLARLILLDYLCLRDGFNNGHQIDFITKDYQDAVELVMSRNSVRQHLGEKLEVFFRDIQFDDGDLYPKMKEIVLERLEKGQYSSDFTGLKLILICAANEAVKLKDQYVKDMQTILLPFMNEKDKSQFLAGCKFGNKPLIYGQFHHGMLRAQMKFLEEMNAKSSEGNILSSYIKGLKEISNIKDMIEFHQNSLAEKFQEISDQDLDNYSIKQQDFLRCKGYFPTPESIFQAVNAIKNHEGIKLVRIKNRIKALGDVMVNYWYGDNVIAEAQLVLQTFQGMTDDQINQYKLVTDFNHFAYELSRNPLGCLVHCIELLIKEQADEELNTREWDAVCTVRGDRIGFELLNFEINEDNEITGDGEDRDGPFTMEGSIDEDGQVTINYNQNGNDSTLIGTFNADRTRFDGYFDYGEDSEEGNYVKFIFQKKKK
ncbi:UNKNOWN [Stylonychia lemnae]|uniref:Uncharacterized protein n=1 Tax=Stylonychia lemnae TaxID=5949 RepID=A0A078B5S6_STYLE|nr:UNKNOWN [Stylonychia lemnae]|eukprot:CDW89774.1 UNKNOWN [Stylonychia lemnae]